MPELPEGPKAAHIWLGKRSKVPQGDYYTQTFAFFIFLIFLGHTYCSGFTLGSVIRMLEIEPGLARQTHYLLYCHSATSPFFLTLASLELILAQNLESKA